MSSVWMSLLLFLLRRRDAVRLCRVIGRCLSSHHSLRLIKLLFFLPFVFAFVFIFFSSSFFSRIDKVGLSSSSSFRAFDDFFICAFRKPGTMVSFLSSSSSSSSKSSSKSPRRTSSRFRFFCFASAYSPRNPAFSTRFRLYLSRRFDQLSFGFFVVRVRALASESTRSSIYPV